MLGLLNCRKLLVDDGNTTEDVVHDDLLPSPTSHLVLVADLPQLVHFLCHQHFFRELRDLSSSPSSSSSLPSPFPLSFSSSSSSTSVSLPSSATSVSESLSAAGAFVHTNPLLRMCCAFLAELHPLVFSIPTWQLATSPACPAALQRSVGSSHSSASHKPLI